ncbi:hypothetical protein HPB47_014765 [Ixodes persulcatus]|uniref:Uncharacterized protein n=1 Tax=Ixodes persulcatus TaxID=34615 RepID=A0AC60R2Q4_IXOPE|nr:hypothetical protein HPB47_014765 [Ixodes persulcatus]
MWKIIGDQADGLSDTVTLPECYLHFAHSFLTLFHSAVFTLEKSNLEPTELYAVMMNLNRQLKNWTEDKFFGIEAKALETLLSSEKVQRESLNLYDRTLTYLEKWSDFDNSLFKKLAELEVCKGVPGILAEVSTGELFGIDFQEHGDESGTYPRGGPMFLGAERSKSGRSPPPYPPGNT